MSLSLYLLLMKKKIPALSMDSTNGTSNLRNHINYQCKRFPGRGDIDKKQAKMCFERLKGDGANLVTHKYDPETLREYVARMIVKDELPFSFVENEGFRELFSKAEPRFHIPSRTTITRDVMKLYLREKKSLRDMFVKKKQRVCLTTDTWKSCQNLHYMCLTAHFIDDSWVLHKKILNYCVIPDSKGDTLGKAIEQCLLEWGLERVFTITVDNASSNNVSVQYVINTVNQWGGAILGGRHMHLRCAAHILNLIVQDGLKDYDESIGRIRDVVRYVRGSSTRMQKLKECVEQAKITSKKTVCLDVATRWNSTYFMLEVAEKYQKAFERMEMHDVGYVKEFCTSNQFLDRVSFIHSRLEFWSGNRGENKMREMTISMKKKYDKYWGKIEDLNPFLLVAIVLDPRYKEPFLNVCFELMCGDKDEATKHCKYVRMTLDSMYKEYSNLDSSDGLYMSSKDVEDDGRTKDVDDDVDEYALFDQLRKKKLKAVDSSENKTEVDKYFIEACENTDQHDFDVLMWWKKNASRFKILSMIAQDVFTIPISTVASESAFSTGGRVIDPYRSCLTSRAVQALICTQNWIRKTTSINVEGTNEEVEAIEAEMLVGDGEIRMD